MFKLFPVRRPMSLYTCSCATSDKERGKIMGMSLDQGGHLTHGHKVSISGKIWQQVPYGVDKKTEVLNYDEIKAKSIAEKPTIIVAGFTAYPRIIDWKKFRHISRCFRCASHGGYVACCRTCCWRCLSFAI